MRIFSVTKQRGVSIWKQHSIPVSSCPKSAADAARRWPLPLPPLRWKLAIDKRKIKINSKNFFAATKKYIKQQNCTLLLTLWCASNWSHYYHLERSMHIRRVTWPIIRDNNNPRCWNPWPQSSYLLCRFPGATTKIKPCYRRKTAFSHCNGYKVYSTCAVSRDLCTRGPTEPHVTIFDTELPIRNTTFYGTTMTTNSSFISAHPHDKANFDCNKTKDIQNGFQNSGILKCNRFVIVLISNI